MYALRYVHANYVTTSVDFQVYLIVHIHIMCELYYEFTSFFNQAGPNYDLKKWEEDQSRIADVKFGAKDAKLHSQVCTLLQWQYS